MQSTPERVKIPAPENEVERVRHLATGSAVVVFSSSDCCMCHVAKQLLFSLGLAPNVVELDSDSLLPPLPAVFVGEKLLGGVEALLACHITGSLVPLLKEAGALWL